MVTKAKEIDIFTQYTLTIFQRSHRTKKMSEMIGMTVPNVFIMPKYKNWESYCKKRFFLLILTISFINLSKWSSMIK